MQPNRRLREFLIWLSAAPVITVEAIALAVLLSGCASYWYHDPALTGFKELPTQIVTERETLAMCGSRKGCTRWLHTDFTVQSFIVVDAGNCAVAHEGMHRAGWMHDGREIYREDCGK